MFFLIFTQILGGKICIKFDGSSPVSTDKSWCCGCRGFMRFHSHHATPMIISISFGVWFFVCLEPRNLFSFSMIDFFCGRGDTPKSPSEPSNLDGGFEHFICSPTLLGKLIEINLPHICFILGLVRAPDDIICSPFLQEIGLGTDLEQYAGSHHDDLCLRLVSWKTDFFPGNPLTWMSREGC